MNVGDKVIFVERYGAKPQPCFVMKVTPKGMIRIDYDGEHTLYRPNGNSYRPHGEGIRGSARAVYSFSDEQLAKLKTDYEANLVAKAAKEAAEQNRRDAAEARHQAELAEVKERMGWVNFEQQPHRIQKEMLPDGSRLYTVNMPIKPQYADRKKGFQRLLVRCSTRKSWRDEGDEVEARYTYMYGGDCGFPSGSNSDGFKNDEDAVLDTIRYIYHSW